MPDSFASLTPPEKVREFSVSGPLFSGYNRTTNTYNLGFTLTRVFSTGRTADEYITAAGIIAAGSYTYTAVDSSKPGDVYEKTFTFNAPPAPPVEDPVIKVANVTVVVTGMETVAQNGNNGNNGDTNNNYRVYYNMTVKLSNNVTATVSDTVVIPMNSGSNTGEKEVEKDITIDNVKYTVTYTVSVE